MITQVKSFNFNREVLQSNKKVVVIFTAPWCHSCKDVLEKFEEWQKEYKDYDFKIVDINKSRQIAKKFSIDSTPTFIIFDGKEIINRFYGHQTIETFKYFLLNK